MDLRKVNGTVSYEIDGEVNQQMFRDVDLATDDQGNLLITRGSRPLSLYNESKWIKVDFGG